MADETMSITVRGEGITLSLLVWRQMKAQPVGFVESVLALNSGLAEAAFLPVGTVVKFPLAVPGASAPPVTVRLWD
jgi:phage tail protein X